MTEIIELLQVIIHNLGSSLFLNC